MLLKAKNIIFRSVGLLSGLKNLKEIQNSLQNHCKNKLIRENAVTRAQGCCSLQIMAWLCSPSERVKLGSFVSQSCNDG